MPPDNEHIEYVVSLPPESIIANLYDKAYFVDAYGIMLPLGVVHDPELLARFIFAHQMPWVSKLMGVRDFIMGWFGLKTANKLLTPDQINNPDRVHLFKIYQKMEHEIIMGEDDKHLDFRVSLLLRKQSISEEQLELVVTTVVQCHNLGGRTYIQAIKPFHRQVVRSAIRNAAKKGWPLA